MTMMETHLSPQPTPAQLRALITTGPTAEAARPLLPGKTLVGLQVERVHFPETKPVQLQIRVRDSGGESHVLIGEWVGAAAADLAQTESARLAKPRRGQTTLAAGPTIVADIAQGLLLRRRGFDAKLPGLRLLHDVGWLGDGLTALGCDPGASIALVAHRLGKRAVLRITGRDGTRFARLRPVTSTSGQAAYQRHLALWTALKDAPDCAVPRPIRFDPSMGLALFDALPGQVPQFEGMVGYRATQAVMQAIASLQALQLDALPHQPADELAILQAWYARTVAVFPDLAQRLHTPLARLQDDMAALTALPLVLCHRDLHEDQILLDQRRAGLLDFDTLRRGDPALDIANLQAHLMLAQLRDGMPRRAFITAMDNAMPQLPLQRIALWRRAALLRLAMIYAFGATHSRIIRGLIHEAAG